MRMHASIVRGAESLGWPGMVGLGLLAFVAAFYFSTYRPEQMRLDDLRGEIAKIEDGRVRAEIDEPKTGIDKLNAFYGYFPPSERIADLLGEIYAVAARQSLTLDQGEYRVVRDSVGRLTHFQVILPVRGTYPQVRKFVAAALASVPNLSLDSVQFERQKVGDAVIEAKIKLVMYLGQRS